MKKPEDLVWYAMRATYRREMDAKRFLDKESLENFIPLCYKFQTIKGCKVRVLVPAINNLVFVHAIPSELQRVKEKIPYLQYITDSRDRQKIVVPNEQMRRFIAVAGSYNDQLLYFKPEEISFAKGTPVRITAGEFEGQEGIFVKVKGARDKRVVISIRGIVAVAMTTIHPDLIEPIVNSRQSSVNSR